MNPPMTECRRCRVDFTRAMLRVHLRHGHRLFTCVICGSAIQRDMQRGDVPSFCTRKCVIVADERGLCRACCKEPAAPDRLHCTPCTARYVTVQRYLSREYRSIDGTLAAIDRAAALPPPYHRAERAGPPYKPASAPAARPVPAAPARAPTLQAPLAAPPIPDPKIQPIIKSA